MRNGLGSALRIGLSKHGIAILHTGGWRAKTTVLADHALTEQAFATPELLMLQCRTLLAEAKCARLPVTVILADDWVRLFMVTPPHNTARLQDCRAATAMRFQALYGEPSSGWRLEADWHARLPFLACAMPHALLAALQEVVLERKLDLISVMPQFIAAWNTWHADLHADAWFGIVQQEALTLGAIDRQRLCAVRAVAIPPDGHSRDWLHAHVMREALRLNMPVPRRLQLYGTAPANWAAACAETPAEVPTIHLLNDARPGPSERIVSDAERLARSGMRT